MTKNAPGTDQLVVERVSGTASLDALYARPGFLMRRAHQISVSLFTQETADLGITSTQYGVLYVLEARGRLDQIGLAQLVGIDRSTAALVVGKLEEAGYIKREEDPDDRRRKLLVLTRRGRKMLDDMAEPARRAQEQALSVFGEPERATFLSLLQTFVCAFNEETRAPIIPEADGKAARRRKNGK
jgi:DNA-binding MarR family transcriptional regulator